MTILLTAIGILVVVVTWVIVALVNELRRMNMLLERALHLWERYCLKKGV